MKKLVENGYLMQERSPHDRRMTRIRLSDKGLDLCNRIDALYERNAAELSEGVSEAERLGATNTVLSALERYWTNFITYTR